MNILYYMFFLSLLCSCETSQEKIKKQLFLENPFPQDVINKYLSVAGLEKLDKGVPDFEIRKWSQFYTVDSFPVILERYFPKNGKLKVEIFLFFGENGRQILSADELKGLKVEKYEMDRPVEYSDSLRRFYNLARIDTFNLDIIRNKNANDMGTSTPKNICFEQATATEYDLIFISNPMLFPGLNKSIDKYIAFAKFTADTICMQDPGFAKWVNEKAPPVFGYSK